MFEKKNGVTDEITALNNRIPATVGEGQTPAAGVSSQASPFRRCMWIDHMIDPADQLEYRVTPMVANGAAFAPVAGAATDWTAPTIPIVEDASGLSCYFNRGVLMSQIVSRFVSGDVTTASLNQFKAQLKDPANVEPDRKRVRHRPPSHRADPRRAVAHHGAADGL